MTRVYIVTEGVHDVAYLSCILRKKFDFKQAGTVDELGRVYRDWIGSFKWPHDRRIDRASVPAPEIYVRPGVEVALSNAGGITEIQKRLALDLEYFAKEGHSLDAIGVVLDADTGLAPVARSKEMNAALEATLVDTRLLRPRRTGVLVLPDDIQPGTLEDVLIPLGKRVYPDLFESAARHVQAAMNSLGALKSDERKEISKPSGAKKALLSCVAAVLKPGKAIQVTLKDNRWISPETLSAAELAPILGPTLVFLEGLLSAGSGASVPEDTNYSV